jgi:hypothetical protein
MTAGKYLPEPGRPGSDAWTMTEWVPAGYCVAGSWAAGSRLMTALIYVPLPPQVRQLALTMLQQVTGPGGTHLLS